MKRKTVEKVLLTILKYILLLIILLCIYLGLLLLTSLIPSSLLKKHVTESSEVLVEEGEKKVIKFLGYKIEVIFTFTDALEINTAYSIDSKQPVQSFLLARKNYIPGQTVNEHADSQYNLGASEQYINKKNGDRYQTKELYGLMHGENIVDSFEYARYWHGYLVLLRPLLVIMNYSGIRILALIATIILVGLLLYKIYKEIDFQTAIIFLIGLLSISIFVVAQGISDIPVYLISLITCIILLYKKDLNKHICELFFVIGSITSFVDLLTAPLITLGLPLIVYLLLLQKEQKKLKDVLISLIKVCFLWAMGYAFTWIAKWVITELMLGRPIISQAIEQAKFRTNSNIKRVDFIKTLRMNMMFLSNNTIIILLVALIGYILPNAIITKKKSLKQNLVNCIPYVITAIIPLIWFFILKEHSFTHAFFTYRILIITIISVLVIVRKIYQVES